ncbi:MAG: PPC domain-containing DNA-binding protein [Acidimicrobiia bacterium]
MSSFTYEAGPVHLVRVPTGEDLLGYLDDFVAEQGITTAWLSYLGAVKTAALRYYDQDQREYCDFHIHEHLEVVSGTGNVSLLDGKPFIHTHAVLADAEGRAFGGHVNYGCEVWALEVKIEELSGDAPIRQFDEETGLSLWGEAP